MQQPIKKVSDEFKQELNEKVVLNCFKSILNDSPEKFIALMEGFDNLNDFRDPHENSLLHIAAYHGCTRKLQYLIDRGCDVNIINPCYNDPLHMACSNGSLDAVKMLIDNGAPTFSPDICGNYGIHHAFINNHNETVNYFFSNYEFDIEVTTINFI